MTKLLLIKEQLEFWSNFFVHGVMLGTLEYMISFNPKKDSKRCMLYPISQIRNLRLKDASISSKYIHFRHVLSNMVACSTCGY